MKLRTSLYKLSKSALITWVLAYGSLEACTGIKLTAKDGSIVHGRTFEFGIDVDTSIVYIPQGIPFVGATPNGEGLKYQVKYASVGTIAADRMAVLDGINEKGLSVGTFYFPGFAGYATIDASNQSKALSPVEFPNWLVTQFATIDEVKAGLSGVVIAPTVTKEWGPTPAPFHYIVYDKSGKSLVIEPVNGKLLTYDNPLGVFTNSPEFPWHLTNLRNYINLTPNNPKPLKIDGMEFASFGQGGGMVGLPGDFTPPSRFVRAAIFSITAIPSETANESIFQAFHLLNQFDIPVGIAREKVGDVVYSDYTLVTCARDPQSLRYYYRTYNDQTIRVVDLTKFDPNSKSIKRVKTATGLQKAVDVTSKLK